MKRRKKIVRKMEGEEYSQSHLPGARERHKNQITSLKCEPGATHTLCSHRDGLCITMVVLHCRYNSYNKDYGLDVYEGDFIDDREVRHGTPSRCSTKMKGKRSNIKRRARLKEQSSSSSSEFEVEEAAAKKRIVSSDEEATEGLYPSKGEGKHGEGMDSGDSDAGKIGVRRSARRRHHSSTQLLSSSEEEEEEGGEKKVRKHRRLELESDDEME